MKLVFERKISASDPAERLKENLEEALQCLRDRESSALVNYIVRDVAKLVKVHGERRLTEQCDEILSLATDFKKTEPSHSSRNYDDFSTDCERDSERMHEANRDILDKMSTMRGQIRKMEDKRRVEMKLLADEVEKYKHLLQESEKRLVSERIHNRRLRRQIHRSPSSCASDVGEDYEYFDSGRFGFGALTVRSFKGPETCRPISAKSRKHRRD
jgi:hypothetical protein